MSTEGFRYRTVTFLRNAIQQRRNLIRGGYSRKPETEQSISKVERKLSVTGNSRDAALLLTTLEKEIFHIIPATNAKRLSKYNREFLMLLNEAKEIINNE